MTTLPDIEPVIVIDTREPLDPHPWAPYLTCETVRGTLETGDFSLPGCGDLVAVERKTLDDLVGCLSHSRERFVKEMERARRIRDFIVICEGSYDELMNGCYRSMMTPQAAWESTVALMLRFSIPFILAGSREAAAKLCESYLRRWLREHEKCVQIATRGLKTIHAGKGC